MTAPQKALLSRLCQRAGLPYDANLDSTQASERIAALMAAPPAQRQPAQAKTAAQRRPAESPQPYLDSEAEEAIAAAERRTGERWHRPADRLRTAAEIDEVAQRAAQPVESPDDEGVAGAGEAQSFGQAGPVGAGAGGDASDDPFAAGGGAGALVEGEGLVEGGERA